MLVSDLLSSCCDSETRWLDCAACRQMGETCPVIVCVECGGDA
jgi:hypothetical protein